MLPLDSLVTDSRKSIFCLCSFPPDAASCDPGSEGRVGVGPAMGVFLVLANHLYWNLMLSADTPPDPR